MILRALAPIVLVALGAVWGWINGSAGWTLG